jgi:hypothetical protein
MKQLPAILRLGTRLLLFFLIVGIAAACGTSRAGTKKRRKVRMPCPCNLHHHFPVYLAYASSEQNEVCFSPGRADVSQSGAERLCRGPNW